MSENTDKIETAKNRHGFRNVFCLGMVSFFTDLSSEMIYPLIPLFLDLLGASKSIIGLIEGIAESTASVLRVVFGRQSDKVGRRKIFIYLGYGLSAVSKPFLYLAEVWPVVLGVRFADRVGKAVRAPARDALISTSIDKKIRGKAFGFHRAMDSLGAVGGPLLALLIITLPWFAGMEQKEQFKVVFLCSFIPAMLALIFIPFARETAAATKKVAAGAATGLRSRPFLLFLIAAIVFTLGNSSNAFLLLKAREAGAIRAGGSTAEIIGHAAWLWALYNLVAAVSSPIFGSLSDRIGRRLVISISFIYYAAVYFLFGLARAPWAIWALFAAYGIHHGLSEGVFRAHIADLVDPAHRATAYGIFNMGIGLALVPASVIFGALWQYVNSQTAFFVSAGFSLLGFLIFLVSVSAKKPAPAGAESQPA